MSETVNLAEARRKLPELADRANAGQAYLVSRRGREIAVLIGVDEYRRLKALEQQQRQKDYDILLAPPTMETLSEEEARQIALSATRDQRNKLSQ
jgi:prevent-host-death family protein